MINIDIFVPALDETFEFRCDENVPLSDLAKNIYELLMRKNAAKSDPGKMEHKKFWFCDLNKSRILDLDESLKDQGIIHGSRLSFF